ncbi:MAG TPA: hypothetical protein DF613_16975 [Lachnospiraceae bacterium]|nr:hypothetical protein [Lachnospiraceae bacterium]
MRKTEEQSNSNEIIGVRKDMEFLNRIVNKCQKRLQPCSKWSSRIRKIFSDTIGSGTPGLPEHCATAIYFSGLLIWLEIFFHIIMFHNLSLTLIYPILFSVSVGILLGIVCRSFSRHINRRILIAATVLICALFCAEVIYKNVFQTYFALFGVLTVASQALDFMSVVLSAMSKSLIPLLFLLAIPLLFAIKFFDHFITTEETEPGASLTALCQAVAVHLVMLLCLFIGGRGIYSPFDLYFNSPSVDNSVDTLGIMATTWLSGKNLLTGKTGAAVVAEETPAAYPRVSASLRRTEGTVSNTAKPACDTSPNILDIDFGKILSDAGNDRDVATLCEYIQNKSGTNKNLYTGMFQGYNLIWISAEGLDKYVITPEWTPTLYKMATEGFVFNNYFTPLWYGSTSGGEWANLTGTVPNNGSYVSMEKSGDLGLNMLFTAGRQSLRLGYTTTGWHNNDYAYYNRDKAFPNMGYDWHGTGQGYDPEVRKNTGKALWPQSDVRLIEQSFPAYFRSEPFMTYYMTVSGHVEYNFSGNAMCAKNKDRVDGLACSEKAKAYIACQMELDLAMQNLLQKLDATGLSERTLIVLAPDHVPYNDMDLIDELSGTPRDEINAYRNTLIIYSASMQQPVIVDKYCSSVDILPTVSNMMGWDYDSRMMVGQDIMSDAEQFIMFPGLSFITGRCIYNAKTKTAASFDGSAVDDEYLASMKKKAYNWYAISDLIYSTDFYKYVEPQIQ